MVSGVPPLGAGAAARRPDGAHRLSLHHAGGRVGAVGGGQPAPLPGSQQQQTLTNSTVKTPIDICHNNSSWLACKVVEGSPVLPHGLRRGRHPHHRLLSIGQYPPPAGVHN